MSNEPVEILMCGTGEVSFILSPRTERPLTSPHYPS